MPKLALFCLILSSVDIIRTHASQYGLRHRVRHGQRIINGTRTPHLKFPFVVSIQAHNISSGEWLHGCGGSIVDAETILTACHCVAPKILGNSISLGNNEIMRVVAGTDSLTQLGPTAQIHSVRELIASPQCSNFPQYDDGWYGHDVGFIILDHPLVFTPEVQPMRVYSADIGQSEEMLRRLVYQGQTCHVPGWGTTEEFKGINSEYLMVSTVNLISGTVCRDMLCRLSQTHCYAHFDNIGQVCGVSKHSSDCQGDSGGPLVCHGMVFGTVSYGERCLPGWPSVFQSIQPILELIRSRTTHHLGQQTMMRFAPPVRMYATSRGVHTTNHKRRKGVHQHKPNHRLYNLGHRFMQSVNTTIKHKKVKESKKHKHER